MSTRTVLAVAFAALQLAVVPAMAQGEGNGPGGAGAFKGWTVPATMQSALAASVGSETYTQSPCYSETFAGKAKADVGSDPSLFAWPALPLGGSNSAVYARASGLRAPRG